MSVSAEEQYYSELAAQSNESLINEIRSLRGVIEKRRRDDQQRDWDDARARERNQLYDFKIRMIWGAIALLLLVLAYLLHSGAINIRWGILVTLAASLAAGMKARRL
ncbi:hypothetical protein [Sinorhizobium fredii]|uniref:hypothetical protein n=1 Tax=Rhizobium fredii TaxID=380 RepID=UPI003517EB51